MDLGKGFAQDLVTGLADPDSKGPAWAFAYGAEAIRERLSDLISAIQAEPDAANKTEPKAPRK